MNYSYYDQISVKGLIRAVQERGLELLQKDFKKKKGTTRYVRYLTELNEMRRSLIPRLALMNRMDPRFFPTGSHVIYQHRGTVTDDFDFDTYQSVSPAKFGRVVAQEATTLLVQFDGEVGVVQVAPEHLKLRFIRK